MMEGYNVMTEHTDSTWLPGVDFYLCPLWAAWPWGDSLTGLWLSPYNSEMETLETAAS